MMKKHRIAAIAAFSVISVAMSACGTEPPETKDRSSMARHAPWTLEEVRAILPPGINQYSSDLRQCAADDRDRNAFICVTMHGSGDLAGQSVWLHAVRKMSPVTSDDFDSEAEIYRPPMFTVERVPDAYRGEFGEYSYTTQKHDDTDVWSLYSDDAFIQLGYPHGAVAQDDRWTLVRKILNEG